MNPSWPHIEVMFGVFDEVRRHHKTKHITHITHITKSDFEEQTTCGLTEMDMCKEVDLTITQPSESHKKSKWLWVKTLYPR